MTYAGTTGLPGTFYLRQSDLGDPTSQPFPAQTQPDNTVQTIVAAPSDSQAPVAGAASPFAGQADARPPTSGYYDPHPSDQRPTSSQAPVFSPSPATAATSQSEQQNSPDGAMAVWLVVAGVLASVVAFFVIRYRTKQAELRAAELRRLRALRTAHTEVEAKAHLLHVRREQLTQPDYYGTVDPRPWEKEKLKFYETRVVPLIMEGGFTELLPEIAPLIFMAIEEAAWRPIDPAKRATFSNPDSFSADMDPVHYEMHCALQLQKAGWTTRSTPRTGDQGADVLAERGGLTLVVQCKLYSNNVGNGAVQEAVAARVYHRTALAVVASNAPFTRSARELAGMSGVTLLHHSQLTAFTGRAGPTEILDEAV